MTSKAALLTVVLAISLTTSNSAIPLHNRTSPTPKQPGLATTLYLRAGFHPPEQRYFVFNSREVDFFQAWHLCASIGLQLASVNTAEDDAALKLAFRAADSNQIGPWWIAGTDLGKNGHFLWITTARPLGYRTGYTNFAPGQPDNTAGREHCVEAGYPSGTLWNDRSCDVRRRYVCEAVTSEFC
ncbi:salivary C-type lectin [Culex quinquefasciatus]|uniref:Salivary C-type lectin n=1 Tax=Culex quinquefasciatus TaxID=7176 RepID=B0WIF1_CULQU|nr:salivary C-type lectin [Culex quinquefasciatus]|eukprot:XP_001848485.1 salivary C-type lectin [Culex quinquefasciatus]